MDLAQPLAAKATMNVACVQLEVGRTAAPFVRSGLTYGGELLLCQRYYQTYQVNELVVGNPYSAVGLTTGAQYATTNFPVTMRIAPTASSTSGSTTYFSATYISTTAGASLSRNVHFNGSTVNKLLLSYTSADNGAALLTSGYAYGVNTEIVSVSAEL